MKQQATLGALCWRLTSFAICASAATTVSAQAANTLCQPSEVVVFSCSIARNGKIASLCASKKLTPDVGYVQYRFGRRERIELEFPNERHDSVEQFAMSFYMRPLVTRASISFENQGNSYAIVSDHDDEDNFKRHEEGVHVTIGSGKRVFLSCGNDAKSNFQHVVHVMPCEEPDSVDCSR